MRDKLIKKSKSIIEKITQPFFNLIKRRLAKTIYVHGSSKRIFLGKNVNLLNTVFNTACGEIYLEDNVIFGHNCMLLTGRHNFKKGKRMYYYGLPDTPFSGYDIRIGEGSWITSGVIITGNVTIGKHSIVCSGAVVSKSFPDHSIIAGVPAKQIGSTLDLDQ